jgi:hypothetical protein
MMIVNNSPDITSLNFGCTWDISGTSPVISLVNYATGSGLANCTWWIVATSPTVSLIHEGSELTPDITGSWTSYVLTDNWPRPFNQIEWSGAPYETTLYVKDSAGNIYSLTKSASICRPAGNTSLSKNPYGIALTGIQVKCELARIWFQDKTNHVYSGVEGTQINSILRVVFPIDETGTVPDAFVATSFTQAMVPISYSSDNYQYVATSVYEYDFGDYVFVRVKYQSRSKNGAFAISFPVLCNIDLCPLVCEVDRLVNSIETGSCSDVTEAQRKLTLINPKLALCLLGKQEPLCGVDVPKLIEEIKQIGGFDCDCCSSPTGIIPQTASVIDGYTFSVVPVCGDVNGTVTVNGSNIQFNLQDKSYIFSIHQDSPQDISAFTVLPSTNGCTKTYELQVDGPLLAQELLEIIAGDGNLVNLFNSIVIGGGGGTGQLIVDGGCIFDSTSTCDYVFTLLNIPVNTTFAIISGIKIGSTNHSLSFAFNLTNLPALQTYLNGLGFGTFVVTNPAGQTVLISTTANASDIQSLTYKISTTSFPASYTKECTGYVPIDANVVVQNLINYLCNINDEQVITSQQYVIHYIDVNGDTQSVTITEGSTLAVLIEALITAGNNTIDNIGELASVSCDTMKTAFPNNIVQPITGSDFIFATKGGGICARVSYLDIFNYMLQQGLSNGTTKQYFCDFVTSCGAGLSCSPYNFLEVTVSLYNTACAPIVGIDYLIF